MSQNWLNVFNKNPYNKVDDEIADDMPSEDFLDDPVFGFPSPMPTSTAAPNVPVPNKELIALLSNHRNEMLKDMVMLCCCVVVFCQIGFGLYHCGLSRSKNALIANFTIFLNTLIVVIGHWATGYTFAATDGTYVIGYTHFWFSESMSASLYQEFLHSLCFSIMAINIIPGGLLERIEPYALGTVAIIFSVIVHPMVIHSAWHTGGWLQTVQIHTEPVQYQDFAGSGTVHVFAGIASLTGTFLLGPRFRRFSSIKKQNFKSHLLGHSSPLCVLGGSIMVLGFLCLHLSRAFSDTTIDGASIVVLNTLIATATSSITAVLLVQIIRSSVECCCWDLCKVKWPVMNLFVNGALAGIAAVAAGCNVYYPWSSAVVGIVAGFAYVFWSFGIAACSIDDPADVFAAHAGGGLWGVVAVAIFGKNGIVFYPTTTKYKILAWNITGGASIAVWSALMTLLFLGPFRAFRRLRVTKEVERTGLDISLFGEMAYPFYAWRDQTGGIEGKLKHSLNDLCKVKWPVMNLFVNGALAGIAAVAAGCNVYYPWSSAVVGIVAGFAYVFWSFGIAACSIDDPADVFAAHAGGGLWGVVAVAIFGKNGIVFYPTTTKYKILAWNITGGASIAVWSALMTLLFLGPFRAFRRLRVTKEVERTGLDISLFGEMAYPFYAWRDQTGGIEDFKAEDEQRPSGYPDSENIKSVPIDRRYYVGFYDF